MRLRVGGGIVVAFMLFLASSAAPAWAQEVDPMGLLLEPPAPGFVSAQGTPGITWGEVTEDGDPAAPGYKPAADSAFVRGFVKTFFSQPNTGKFAVVGVAEMTSAAMANIGVDNDIETAVAEGGTEFAVQDIPRARGMSQDKVNGSDVLRTEMVEFPRAKYTLIVVLVGPRDDFDRNLLVQMARAEYDHVAKTVPETRTQGDAAAEAVADAIDEDSIVSTLVLAGAAVTIAAIVVVGLVVVLRKKKSPAVTTYPAMWTPPPRTYGDDSLLPQDAPNGGAVARPQSTWAPPMPADLRPPTAPPVGSPVGVATPAAPAAPVATPAPAPTPVGAPLATREVQECPNCQNVFGNGTECATCQAARTMCAVCGVKIWAGAMTCSAHSGFVR